MMQFKWLHRSGRDVRLSDIIAQIMSDKKSPIDQPNWPEVGNGKIMKTNLKM